MIEQEAGALRQLAVDGRVRRGSGRQDGQPLPLLSAVTHHRRLTLDQVALAEKSNEIPALNPPPGGLIIADALHHPGTGRRFYLFGLKGNQGGILNQVQRLLAQQAFPLEGPWEKGHHRLDCGASSARPSVPRRLAYAAAGRSRRPARKVRFIRRAPGRMGRAYYSPCRLGVAFVRAVGPGKHWYGIGPLALRNPPTCAMVGPEEREWARAEMRAEDEVCLD